MNLKLSNQKFLVLCNNSQGIASWHLNNDDYMVQAMIVLENLLYLFRYVNPKGSVPSEKENEREATTRHAKKDGKSRTKRACLERDSVR